ncbi:hypothetical protein H0H93_003530 [Arthromyces matolae]|nr:hypothetical protein H0H93_003530 [Arthromyces matolae]
MTDTTSTGPSSGPHLVRITDSGKIKTWVAYALNIFETDDNKPICFHTLPATNSSKTINTDQEASSTPKLSKATTAVPRLLTVVEIVKREFLKSLRLKSSPRLAGLHQYNEIGFLDAPDIPSISSEEDRTAEIRRALSGTNYVKQKQIPYMKITLSLNALPELAQNGATYQTPQLRTLSKSAKMRMKKRERAKKHVMQAEEPSIASSNNEVNTGQ